MNHKKIRIGVAGLGRIGWNFHCKVLSKHPDFDLVAVADPMPKRRREAEKVFGCSSYEDFSKFLEHSKAEAVAIATPTHLHKPQALEAFRKGMHVVLEKPMAMSARDAQTIVKAAKHSRKALTVYQPHRVIAYFQHLKKLLASGKIGPVYHVRRCWHRFARRDDWQALKKYGGGMLNNYGAHCLDQLLQLTGYDVAKIFCNLRLVASLGDAEDVVKVIYETKKGVVGEMDINMASAASPNEFEIWGTKGCLSFKKETFTLRSFSPAELFPKHLNSTLTPATRAYPQDNIEFLEKTIPVDNTCKKDFYADFAHSICTGKAPLIKPEEAQNAIRLLEKCRKNSGRIFLNRIG